MTYEEIKKTAFTLDQRLETVLDSGKMFDGYRIFMGFRKQTKPYDFSGPPIFFLVKGGEIRKPTREEVDEVDSIASAPSEGTEGGEIIN